MSDLFIISKEFTFEAAHHLPQMPDGHKCKRQHGHSYRVIVELRASKLDQFGFVRDFGELALIKSDIDTIVDHYDLATIFGGENTTAERLAEMMFYRWQGMVPELYSVTVCETEKTRATFIPSDSLESAGIDIERVLRALKSRSLEQFGTTARWSEL